MNLILINTYSSLLSSLFMLGIGIFVFLRKPKEKLSFIFLLFCLSVAIWLFCTFMMYRSKSDIEVIFWDRMVYLGVVFIPIFMYHFGLIFTNTEIKNQKKLYCGYFFSFLFLILSRTDYFVADLYKYNWGFHTRAKFFHHLFLLFFFVYILLFLYEIYKFLKNTEKKKITEIKQVKYLFLSFIVMNIGAYAFLPAYGIDINPIGAYLIEAIAVLILSFAILKYHLFEIKVILTEMLVGAMGIVLGIFVFIGPVLSPNLLRFLSLFVFFFFLLFAYLLLKSVYKEEKLKEKVIALAKRERELRIGEQRLRHARDQFILSSQHYFRTPVSSIIGYLQLVFQGFFGKVSEKWKKN